MRLDAGFWERIYERGIRDPFGSVIILLVGLTGFTLAPRRLRMIAFCCLAAWFSGFLVWSNLFFVHHYYFYENTFFLILWVVLSLGGTIEWKPILRYPVVALVLLMTVGQFQHHYTGPTRQGQINDWGSEKTEFGSMVGTRLDAQEVLMVLGDDWNPIIPFYAGKYALMVRWPNFWEGDAYRESIVRMQSENRNFGGIVVRNEISIMEEFTRLLSHFEVEVGSPQFSRHNQWVFYPVNHFPQLEGSSE